MMGKNTASNSKIDFFLSRLMFSTLLQALTLKIPEWASEIDTKDINAKIIDLYRPAIPLPTDPKSIVLEYLMVHIVRYDRLQTLYSPDYTIMLPDNTKIELHTYRVPPPDIEIGCYRLISCFNSHDTAIHLTAYNDAKISSSLRIARVKFRTYEFEPQAIVITFDNGVKQRIVFKDKD